MRRALVVAALVAVTATVAGRAGAQEGGPPTVGAITSTFFFPTNTYVVEASDADGDELTFAWTKTGRPCGDFTQSGDTAEWSHPDASVGGDCPNEPVHPASIAVVVTDGDYECRVEFPDGSDVGTGPAPAPCVLLAATTPAPTTPDATPAVPAEEIDDSLPVALIGGIGAIGLLAVVAAVVLVRRRSHPAVVADPGEDVFAGDCDSAWQEALTRAQEGRDGLHDPLVQTATTLVGGAVGALEALATARKALEQARIGVAARLTERDGLDVRIVPLDDTAVRIVLRGNAALDELTAGRAETSGTRAGARAARLGAATGLEDVPGLRRALTAAYRGLPPTDAVRGVGAGLLAPVAGARAEGGNFVDPVRVFNEPDAALLGALEACDGDLARLPAQLGDERYACLQGAGRLAAWLPALSAIDQAGPAEGDGDVFEGWADLEGSLDRDPVADVHGLSGRRAVDAVARALWRDLTPSGTAGSAGLVEGTLAEAPDRLREAAKGLRDKALDEVKQRAGQRATRDTARLEQILHGCSRQGPEWAQQRAVELDRLRAESLASIAFVEEIADHVGAAADGFDLLAEALEQVAAIGEVSRTARALEAAQGLLLLELSAFQHTFLPAGSPPPPGHGFLQAAGSLDGGG